MIDAPSPIDFFAKLRWLDGRPLPDTIEPYRRHIFETVLYTFDGDIPLTATVRTTTSLSAAGQKRIGRLLT